MSLTFTLPWPPSVNALYRRTRAGGVRLSDDARQFKHDAGVVALAQGVRPMAGPLVVTLTLYRPRRAGDLDNYQKVVFDALQGIAFENDKQIVRTVVARRDDPGNPRVDVTIAAAEAQP